MTNIQQEITELKQRIAELEAREREWLQYGDYYHFLTDTGTEKDTWDGAKTDKCRLERGIVFRTKEEAENADRKRIAIAEWNRLAGDQSWVKHSGGQCQFHPIYDNVLRKWNVGFNPTFRYWYHSYHKTPDDCEAAIAKMAEKMNWLLY